MIRHAPRASATPLTSPAHNASAASATHPLVELRSNWKDMSAGRTGAINVQKPTAMSAPVTLAPMKPASDLRGARGRRSTGVRFGSGGVNRPHARPMVDAAVSAQDRLQRMVRDGRTQKLKLHVHENGHRRHVKRIRREGEVDAEDVPYDAIDLIPFAVAHEEADHAFVQPLELRVAEADEIQGEDYAERAP